MVVRGEEDDKEDAESFTMRGGLLYLVPQRKESDGESKSAVCNPFVLLRANEDFLQ